MVQTLQSLLIKYSNFSTNSASENKFREKSFFSINSKKNGCLYLSFDNAKKKHLYVLVFSELL